jgi:hypothetical protein
VWLLLFSAALDRIIKATVPATTRCNADLKDTLSTCTATFVGLVSAAANEAREAAKHRTLEGQHVREALTQLDLMCYHEAVDRSLDLVAAVPAAKRKKKVVLSAEEEAVLRVKQAELCAAARGVRSSSFTEALPQ